MKVSTFGIKLWRWASMLGFAAILLYAYTSFNQTVAVGFTPQKSPDRFLDREVLFYGCVATFLIVNALVSTLARLFPRIPGAALPIPNQGLWVGHRDELNELARSWFYGLMAAVNTVMALAIWVLSNLNKQLGVTTLSGFEWLLPTVLLVLILASGWLPVRLMMKPDARD